MFKNKIAILVLFLMMLLMGCYTKSDNDFNHSVNETEVNSNVLKQFNGNNLEIFDMNTAIPVKFIRAVDGDTIKVTLNGYKVRVRYLMIDTPESKKDGVKVQPYGIESYERNQSILSNSKQVYIVFDKGRRVDDYNRVLAYVYADNILVSQQLLLEGLATVSYINPPANSLEKEFRQAQNSAKSQGIGVWSIPNYVTKNGKFNQVH